MVDSAKDGGVIKLDHDYTYYTSGDVHTVVIPEGKSVTIDLNGHKIDGLNKNANSIFTVAGTLVLQDSSSGKTGTVANGHGQTGSGTSSLYGGGFYIRSGGSLVMEAGKITGETGVSYGGAVYIDADGTFTMKGGTISGNTGDAYGAAVEVNGGTFEMTGGTITGNESTTRGTVYVKSGTFTMRDGTISGNTGRGGVCVNALAVFDMYGGTISGNRTSTSGGGVYVLANGRFNLYGGTVTGNTASSYGGGVCVLGAAKFHMYGGTVSGNTCGQGKDVFVHKNGVLDGNGADGRYVVEGTSVLFRLHTDRRTVTATALTFSTRPAASLAREFHHLQDLVDAAPDNGTVRLDNDFVYSWAGDAKTINIVSGKRVTIDLNGHKINGSSNNGYAIFTVAGSLTVKDGASGGTVLNGHGKGYGGSAHVKSGGSFTLEGGTLGASKGVSYGGGVYVNGGSFAMKGGAISGNTGVTYGGAVYIDSNGSFVMNGGTISNNTGVTNGGAVYVKSGTVEMAGGAITGNSSSSRGAVYVEAGAFTMRDGRISDNTGHGGIELNAATTFDMYGGSITGNRTPGNGAGVSIIYNSKLDGAKFNMYGGTISGNNAGNGSSYYGGGVYVPSKAEFTMHGGTISGNSNASTATAGKDVYAAKGAFVSGAGISGTHVLDGTSVLFYPRAARRMSVAAALTAVPANARNLTCEFYRLQDLVDAAEDGGVIVLDHDFAYYSGGGDVRTIRIPAGKKVAIDLNGHKVDGLNQNGNSIFTVSGDLVIRDGSSGQTGTVKGRQGNSSGSTYGGGVYVKATGSFTLEGGTITGNTGVTYGGGVYGGGGSFVMKGGAIKGNTGSTAGGAVYAKTGTVEMTGGTITGNSSGSRGAVYVQSGTFTMRDGTISGNTGHGGVELNTATFSMYGGSITGHATSGHGGGVCVSTNSKFNLYGGTISGNRASGSSYYGGVYVYNTGEFNMYGGTVTGNTAASDGGGVYVAKSGKFYMHGGTLGGNTAASKRGQDIFAKKDSIVDGIGIGGEYILDGTSVLFYPRTTSVTSVDTALTAVPADARNLTCEFVHLKDLVDDAPDGGKVKLDHDFAYYAGGGDVKTITVPAGKKVTIDLNGHKVDGLGTNANVIFTVNGDLVLRDTSRGKTGSVVNGHATGSGGGFTVNAGGSLTMEGGTVTGHKGLTNGAGVYVNGGSFTMKGGAITGNGAANGSAVYVYSGSFSMSGGIVAGNTSSGYGAVYLRTGTSFDMSGGAITGNTSTNNGGGVYVGGNVTVKMSGGLVGGNTTRARGGGLYLAGASTLDMSGGLVIGNSASTYGGGGGDVYSGSGVFHMNGGTVSGNTAASKQGQDIFSKKNSVLDGSAAGDRYVDENTGVVHYPTETGKATADSPLKADPTALDGIGFATEHAVVGINRTYFQDPVLNPADAAVKSVSWSSSNTGVATVDAGGTVTGIWPGTATITCRMTDLGGRTVTGTYTVEVKNIPVDKLAVIPDSAALVAGGMLTLNVVMEPDDATIESEAWSSSDTGIAGVAMVNPDTGRVAAVTPGKAVITYTVMDADGKVTKASCDLSVREAALSPAHADLKVGDTIALKAAVLPDNAGIASMTWTSDNTDAVTVDSTGRATAAGLGTAVITCTLTDEDGLVMTAVCSLTVTHKVAISRESMKLAVGSTAALAVTVEPAGAGIASAEWTSDNEDVATVDSAGKVTGIGPGTTVVTYALTDTNDNVTEVSCVVAVREAIVSPESATIAVGGRTRLAVAVQPEDVTVKSLSWSSSDTGVAAVDTATGEVTGIAPGKAVVTCTVTDADGIVMTSSCDLTVRDVTVAPALATVAAGGTLMLRAAVVPDGDGIEHAEWSSSNASVAMVDADTGEVTGIAPGSAVIAYTVTDTDGTSVSAACRLTVIDGPGEDDEVWVTVSPAAVTLDIGSAVTLDATVNMDEADIAGAAWSSDNTGIATVDADGGVFAVAAGTAHVTYAVTDADGNVRTASCIVAVRGSDVSLAGFAGLQDVITNGKPLGGRIDYDSGSNTATLLTDVIYAGNGDNTPVEIDPGVTVTIDLNGHRIDGQGSNGNSVLTVASGGRLTVKDSASSGAVTGGNAHGNGGGVHVDSGGTFVLEGGAVTGNTADMGGGVYNDGTFAMAGGKVCNNEAGSAGDDFYMAAGSSFELMETGGWTLDDIPQVAEDLADGKLGGDGIVKDGKLIVDGWCLDGEDGRWAYRTNGRGLAELSQDHIEAPIALKAARTSAKVEYSWAGLPEGATQNGGTPVAIPETEYWFRNETVPVDTKYAEGFNAYDDGMTYAFSGWSVTEDFVMSGEDVEITGEWENVSSSIRLPRTGGAGTGAFILGGGMLALCAVLALAVKRRRDEA